MSNEDRIGVIGTALLIAVVLAMPCVPITGACTIDHDTAADTLGKQGLSDVTVGDYAWFSCSSQDRFSATFTATNPVGDKVEGVLCCGLFKACTVRW